jgi:hypothetical protein
VVLREVVKQGIRARQAIEPKGSPKRSATLRQREALGVGMQVRSTTARGPSRVREQGSVDHDDAQQV